MESKQGKWRGEFNDYSTSVLCLGYILYSKVISKKYKNVENVAGKKTTFESQNKKAEYYLI